MFPFNLEMQSLRFKKKLIALEKKIQTTYDFLGL
jgi:hypothetical protein